MKLQVALDDLTVTDGLDLCEQIRDWVDIIEIGTPLLVREGLDAVRAFRRAFSEKEIFADAKIMDAGGVEAADCFEAGADLVTVLAVTDILTVRACVETAEQFRGRMVADMICVRDLEQRVAQMEACGIRDLAVHTGIDQQHAGRTPLQDLRQIRACSKHSQIYVAGGIQLETVDAYVESGADVLIIGGAMARSERPDLLAQALAERVHGKMKDRWL